MLAVARLLSGRRLHMAWIVAAMTFLVMLAAAGVRATPSVLIVPLEQTFGWQRATISLAIAVNIFLFGFMGPFAAAAMQRFGIRRVVLSALAILALSVASTTLISTPWQLVLTWGILVGIGSGALTLVFAATIVSRWFSARRGLVMGLLTASNASGQLVFLPILATIAQNQGWKPVAWMVAAILAGIIPLVFFLLPERPSDVGERAYGATEDAPPQPHGENPILRAFSVLTTSMRRRDFWLLFASFFICGLSTNGFIGTHLIAACMDRGMPEVTGAGLLAAMGIFDIIGTTLSGWLSDRYDNRWLLFAYYGLRGLSLMVLPFTDFSFYSLGIFALFYGLDWVATVPPTLRLATNAFGKEDAPVVFGWIATGHQIGAATAALGAGIIRTAMDGYLDAFLIAGAACLIASLMVLTIGRGHAARVVPAAA